MSTTHYLAIDLGAESGRVMLGTLADGTLRLEEVHRFPNRVQEVDGHLHWDLPHLEAEIFRGIDKAAGLDVRIAGLSTDSWGVDYVLVDEGQQPLAAPFCYRDGRTTECQARFFKKVPLAEVYAQTGIQLMAINTLYQLEAESREPGALVERATKLLLMADYFNARLGGVPVSEQSLASTTQLYDPVRRAWSEPLIGALGLRPSLFPRLVPAGTVLGPLLDEKKTGPALADAQVVASCSHDTGAAVAAVPAVGDEEWAYLSSGTWSLLGAELAQPVLTEEARVAGFTNEVGVHGSIRFLKNIVGLWVVQECRRTWEAQGQTITYAELTQQAADCGPATAHLALDDPRFLAPGQMPEKIAAFCRETGQPVPESMGQCVRVILESLAQTYADVLRQLEEVTGRTFATLHLVGGGSRNELLNQLTANATGRTLVAGPAEATAIGNILIQALALGHLSSLRELRDVVERSFPTKTFQPNGSTTLRPHANRRP